MSLRIIAGKFKGRLLKTPKGSSTRPTQGMLREALFNICQDSVVDAHFLDLFAGSGAIGLEALSRGAAHVSFVEKDRLAANCLRENIETLQASTQAVVYSIDYRVALKRLGRNGILFDILYVDPPYDQPLKPILEEIVSYPILKPTTLLFVEQRALNAKPISLPGLSCTDSRKFGDALLEQYTPLCLKLRF